jgi:hypothetical protein
MNKFFTVLVLTAAALAFPDTIMLKTGVAVEGDIIGKSETILKVYSEIFHRAIVIEKEQIDHVIIDGKQVTFEELKLKSASYNPKFRVSPRRGRRPKPKKPKVVLFEKDIFDQTRRENADSAIQGSRKMNLFFNAPSRWGSVGFGYFYAVDMVPQDKDKFREFNFIYKGGPMDLHCLDVQVRRNFRGGVGSLIIDLGYGRKILRTDAFGNVVEAAIMRYVSARYSLCWNKWLFAPGVFAGIMFNKAGVIHYPGSGDSMQVSLTFDDRTLRPLVGLDFNLYDVVTAAAHLDLIGIREKKYYLSLAFMMPFLQ